MLQRLIEAVATSFNPYKKKNPTTECRKINYMVLFCQNICIQLLFYVATAFIFSPPPKKLAMTPLLLKFYRLN